jgi:integrase
MATDFSTIDTRITQVNQRLKAARLGLIIERRGEKLTLRGTLPPRPDSPRLRPHQQRISLNLPATSAGLKQAEQEAKVIAAQLIQRTFDWRHYSNLEGRLRQMDLPQTLEAFEHYFFAQPQRVATASTKTTWQKAYAPYLRKLKAIAQSQPHLSLAEVMYATVRSTPANSRSRQICCTALSALAEFLQLELPIELKSLAGNYGNSQTQVRSLPSDEDILSTVNLISNPAWRFVYGIMATFGLRNHEVFFCDYSALIQQRSNPTIEVLETTKTGTHEVWPFHPEWIEHFQLAQMELPPVNTDLSHTTLQQIGHQVTKQFQRYNLPFSPYDLRHAWAVRTIHLGIPDTVAAKMMGHSVAIHNRTYHRWITRRDQQQAVEAAMRRRKAEGL